MYWEAGLFLRTPFTEGCNGMLAAGCGQLAPVELGIERSNSVDALSKALCASRARAGSESGAQGLPVAS